MFVNMTKWGLNRGDLVFHSDLDEIPRPTIVKELKHCDGFVNPGCLQVRFFYYGFEYFKPENWFHPNFELYDPANPIPVSRWRSHHDGNVQGTCLKEGGWHISWAFDSIDAYRNKMKWYSHAHGAFNVELLKMPDEELAKMIVGGYNVVTQIGKMGKAEPEFKRIPQESIDMPLWLLHERPPHLRYLWDRLGWANSLKKE